ncbi:hypothetical protein C7C56_020910, partial [Massilia glaciei]
DPADGSRRPIAEVVRGDLERLAQKTTDPDFGLAVRMIEQLLAGGGQSGWLKSHMDAGSGMNDIARYASEQFEHK